MRSFNRVRQKTPGTRGDEDWQRPALTQKAEMWTFPGKAWSMVWYPSTRHAAVSRVCVAASCQAGFHAKFQCQLSPYPLLPAFPLSPSLSYNPMYGPNFETLHLNCWGGFLPQSKLQQLNLKRVNLSKHRGSALLKPRVSPSSISWHTVQEDTSLGHLALGCHIHFSPSPSSEQRGKVSLWLSKDFVKLCLVFFAYS